jgi:outer membrane protein insertion porin family
MPPTTIRERALAVARVAGRATASAALCLPLCIALSGQQQVAQPPSQRPPGATPAAQSPPHPTPHTPPQINQTLPIYEGQTVAVLELTGQPDVDTAALLASLPQKQGQPFSRAKLDQSIALLKQHFKDVRLDVTPEMNGLRVGLVLEPADYFGIYEFPGADRFAYTRLLDASGFATQEPYSVLDIESGRKGLIRYFQRNGYFLAKVTPQPKLDARNHVVNVTYRVTLGPHAKFGDIVLNGVTPAEAARLRSSLHSIMARLRGAAVLGNHGYSLTTLRKATSYLQGQLNGQNHLAAEVQLANARYDPRTNRAAIIFNVRPGPVVHLTVGGTHLWPWTRHQLIPIYSIKRIDPTLVQQGQSELTSYMASHGYFNAQVTTTVAVDDHKQVTSASATGPATPPAAAVPASSVAPPPLPPSLSLETTIGSPPPAAIQPATTAAAPAPPETIHYQVEKGPRHVVKAVEFRGNKHFTDSQLASQVTVKPKSWWVFSHGSFSSQKLQESVSNLKSYYAAEGFNGVQITPAVSRLNGDVIVTFKIKEGRQDRVASLRLDGNTLPISEIAPKGLQLSPGQPYTEARLKNDRNELLASYLSHGYLNATVREKAMQVPQHPNQVDVVYQINEGPQVRVGTVVTDGRVVAKQRYIDMRTQNLHAEDYLSENEMMTAETKLYQPGIFDWADVGPLRPVTTQPDEDVVVRVHEAKRNLLTYGFGFDLTNRGGSIPSGTVALPSLPPVGLPSTFTTSQSTFWGPTGNVEYTRLDIGGKAQSFSVGAFAGRLDQRLNIAFTDPNFLWSSWSSNFLASGVIDEENPIFSSRVGDLAYQVQKALSADKTQNLFLRYDFNETQLSRILIPGLVPQQDRHVRLSTLAANYIRDTRDNPLDAHKGVYETAEIDYNPIYLGSTADFARLLAQVAKYQNVHKGIIWANSFRVGFDKALSGSFVPLSQSFFSGGGSTLRGFPLDGAGPQKTIPACGNPADKSTCSFITVPVGGDELAILNSEFRIPTPRINKNLGVVAFYDGGNVFSHIGFTHLGANWSNSVGFGLRYSTPVGPVRIDFGHNLSSPTGIKSTQIFITLGQAF